jgi:hypothetical protein
MLTVPEDTFENPSSTTFDSISLLLLVSWRLTGRAFVNSSDSGSALERVRIAYAGAALASLGAGSAAHLVAAGWLYLTQRHLRRSAVCAASGCLMALLFEYVVRYA